MPIAADVFKQVMSRFCTGVTVVTVRSQNQVHGLTVSAFSSLSLAPPLILVCIGNKGASHEFLVQSDSFAVNVLSEDQQDLASRFANPKLSSDERFEGCDLQDLPGNPPVFQDVMAYLVCKKVERFAGGDHSIFVGEAQQAQFHESNKPLLYYQGGFCALDR